MPDFIYGRWPVLETLRANRRQFEQLLVVESAEDRRALDEIVSTAEARGVRVNQMPRRVIDDLAKGANHQGVVLRVGPYPYVDVRTLLETSVLRQEKNFFLALDLLQDPQNVGTLLRTAEALGVHGAVLQERRAVGVTPAVVSASSGAVEHLLVAQVTNLPDTMQTLKARDVWIAGLEATRGAQRYDRADLSGALALAVGSEGEGLRRLVQERCDFLVELPMQGKVSSLNAAIAGSVVLYEAWRQRAAAPRKPAP